MFCEKCGASLEEGTLFCTSCGAKVGEAAPAAAPEAPAKKKGLKPNNKLIGLIAGGVAALAVIILLVSLIFGRSAKATAKQAVKATLKGDGKAIVNLLHKEMLEAYEDQLDMDKDDLIDQANDALEEELEELDDEIDDKWKVTYKVTKVKELSKKEVKELNESLEDNDIDLEVSKAAEVRLELTLKVDGEKEKDKIDISVIKVGGKWYLASPSAYSTVLYSIYSMYEEM